MKNLKLKIFSLALCVCMCLSFFTGCSLFLKDTSVNDDAVALEIAGEKVTKQELINAYYSFYQQNNYYFMYADEEAIMNTFYDAVVSREIILAEANKLLKDKTIVFSEEEINDIWNDVFDYVYEQIDQKEKSLLLLIDSKEENLPERLQENEDEEEKPYKLEPYVCDKLVEIDYSETEAAPEIKLADKVQELVKGIYTYNKSIKEDEREMVPILESEKENRLKAYERYLSDLIISAKANKKDISKDVVLSTELERIYNSYYENALYNKYQEFVESTAAGINYEGLNNPLQEDGKFVNLLSDAIIEAKYKELLNASAESNTVLENYVSVITSNDTESLILYHHEGKYTYFTVQHLLVSFDNDTLEYLKDIPGYDTAKDKMFRDTYEQIRATFAKDNLMSTSYRDEDGYTVKNAEGKEEKVSVLDIRNAFDEELQKRIEELDHKIDSEEVTFASEEEKALAYTRIRTLLFNEFAWKYSGDTGSLTNEKLSGVLGFTISSETDEHGSLVKDFANGARAMYERYLADKEDGTISTDGIGMKIDSVVSDYGIHMMMLTGVYEAGAVAETVEDLKTTYVSNLTEQTLYEYIYDIVKAELVGDKGTYFSKYTTALVQKYKDENLVNWVDKMSYEQLQNSIA